MKKKLLILLLILAFLTPLSLAGCTKDTEKIHIVYLGDSIGEGIAGMRPVSERENDAYYGIVGQRNNYDYKNRAISGTKSKGLLEYIQQPDDGIRMTQSLIRSADIIHVSILGNDLLLADIGKIITSIASEDYTSIDVIAENAKNNVAGIVEKLKEYNPDAVLMLQPVYNPVFGESDLITASARTALAAKGIGPDQYRRLAAIAVERVDAAMYDYLEAHPGAFYLIDAYAEFNRIYDENPERGKDLVFVDDAHPSAEGHAIMADMIQATLEEIGLADHKDALREYKSMRIAQLERLYSETVDVKAVKKQINKAKSCEEITEIYFDAIADKMPDYY